MESLTSFLYVSDLAPGADRSCVATITSISRINNQRDEITGLLVFDGARFAQYVEGPARAIDNLRLRLGADLRHVDMDVLTKMSVAERRFPTWRLGYLKFDLDEFGIAGLRGQRGPKALDAFTFMLPVLNMEVGDARPSGWSAPNDR